MRIYPIKLYFKAIPNALFIVTSMVANAAIWGWLIWQIRPQEEFIFLHYNVLFGVDRVGPWWHIFFLPVAGLFVLLTNAIVGWLFHEKDPLVGYFFNLVTLIAHLFLGIAAYLLVFLNV